MQSQDYNGTYGKPEPLNEEKLIEELSKKKRFLVFKSLDEQGKPTPEMRRAWRRYNRTKR